MTIADQLQQLAQLARNAEEPLLAAEGRLLLMEVGFKLEQIIKEIEWRLKEK